MIDTQSVAPEEAVERHRAAMRTASYAVTGNWDDAEDATSEAIEKALTKRPQLREDDWAPWLCRVAQNKAKDILRRKKREQRLRAAIPSVSEVLADRSRDVELGAGTRTLLDRIRPFIQKNQEESFNLYCRVELGHVTVGDLAKELGIAQEALRSRLRRVGEAAHNAAVAVCLVDDPGEEPNRCIGPFSLASGKAASPALLVKITRHVNGCEICRGKREKSGHLRRHSLLVPGIGLTAGLLASLVQAILRKKSAAIAVTTTAAAVTVAVLVEQPEARPIPYPALPSRTSAASTTVPPSTMLPIPPPGTVKAEVEPPPAPPQQVPPPPVPEPTVIPAATTVPAPAPGGGSRNDSRPAISGGSVEHRKITTTEQGRCGDKPTTSGVDATVTAPGGLRSVTAYLWRDGQEIPFPMTNIAGTSAWHGQLASEDTDGRFAVAILAVGANGEWTAERIGKLCILKCS